MSKLDKTEKDVKCTVSLEVWKKLKILSIQKEITLSEMVNLVLETFVSKKKIEVEENT